MKKLILSAVFGLVLAALPISIYAMCPGHIVIYNPETGNTIQCDLISQGGGMCVYGCP